MTHTLAVLVSGTGRHLENLAELAAGSGPWSAPSAWACGPR